MIQAVVRLAAALLICSSIGAATAVTMQRGSDARTREVYVSVLDKKGAPVRGLTPADLMVREDGVAREVLSVRPAETPLQLALIVDDSEAAADAIPYLRDGLTTLLDRLAGKAAILLMTVGDRPTVLTQYTTDTARLKSLVNRLFHRPGSGAYLLEGIVDASRSLVKREVDRPVILAITFEGVQFSNRNYDLVLDELKKSGAALHVIAIGRPADSLEDEMRNRNIVIAEGTSRTGGRRDQVLALTGIRPSLEQAADELLNQYVVTYGSPERLVPPEKLDVRSTRPDITVRARTRVPDR